MYGIFLKVLDIMPMPKFGILLNESVSFWDYKKYN